MYFYDPTVIFGITSLRYRKFKIATTRESRFEQPVPWVCTRVYLYRPNRTMCDNDRLLKSSVRALRAAPVLGTGNFLNRNPINYYQTLV